jgi:hypothetical protein
MKRTKLLIVLTFCFVLSGCKKEVEPTSFEGKVVYSDDSTPITDGFIKIAGVENVLRPGFCCIVESSETQLSASGNFNITFDASENIDYFRFAFGVYKDSGVVDLFSSLDGLDCSPYDCDDFESGKNYKNLVIKVPR